MTRPEPPKLWLPEPYCIFDFGNIRAHGKSIRLDIQPTYVHGAILVVATITNPTAQMVLVPPPYEHSFDFSYWKVLPNGNREPFDGPYRKLMVLARNLEKTELISLLPAMSISTRIGIPGVQLPKRSTAVLVSAEFWRYTNQDGKQVLFDLKSEPVQLAHYPAPSGKE